MRWTERQLQAIKVNDKDILVSASAGSGKTAVLSERIVDLILNNKVDIDKFIVVTFTKLAANEMKQRIVKNLEKMKTDALDKDLERFIERQIILAQKANISTLHSFGLSLIKDYFYLLNLSPNVDMIDEVEEKMIKAEVMDEIFNNHYASGDINFKRLTRMYGGFRNDNELKALVNKFATFALNMVNPLDAVDDAIQIYVDSKCLRKEELYDLFKKETTTVIEGFIESLREYESEHEVIQSDLSVLSNIVKCIDTSFETAQFFLSGIKFETLRFPKEYDGQLKAEIQRVRKEMKDYIRNVSKVYFKDTKEVLEEMLNDMREPIKVLAEMTKDYMNGYDDVKRGMNKIDFNDIEHLTLRLLLDDRGEITDICRDIRDTYRYIIVDEYQDINEVQETILKSISTYKSEVPNMFMVGDIKQSIYRFRKADPEIFANKYNNFSKDMNSSEYKIDLNQNFRSRKEVLNSINTIFEKIMKKSIGDIEYDDEMKLVYGDLYSEEIKQDYKTEEYIIVNQSDGDGKEEYGDEEGEENQENIIEDISKYEKEALVIANKINEYMNNKFQVYDMKKQSYRDVRYSDFVILLRSMGNDSYTIYNKLYSLGFPVIFGKEENFIKRIEILQLINILKILDNPYDDIPIVSTLYSQMFKFTCEDLYKISKNKQKNVTFVDALKSYDIEDKLNDKIRNFLAYYDKWSEIAKNGAILQLVNQIAEDTDIMLDMLYEDNAIIKQNGIKQFIELVDKYEKSNNSSLSDFISYINFIIENNIEIISETETEIDDSISIMTIHKSKGLEYPIVFIPMMGKNFNMSDSKERVILDKKYGLISSYINSDKYFITSNFYRQVLIDKLNKENLAEEMRVLYVAMTRAKEKLIMIGTTKDDSIMNEQKARGSYYSIIKSKSYLDLIKPSAFDAKKDIKVEVLSDVKYKGKEMSNVKLKDIEMNDKKKGESFVYPYNDLLDKSEKVSVTQLKLLEKQKLDETFASDDRSNDISNVRIIKPKLLTEDKMTPTQKGTVIHKIMKIIDDSMDIDKYFEKFIQEKIFTEEELVQVEKEKIDKYLRSEIFSRIKNAKLVKKEMPFMMRKKASEVYDEVTSNDDYVIIQGIVDCMFEEDDGIVILDYKTDKIKDGSQEEKQNRIEEIKNDYRKQLELYEEAITKLTKKKVKEKVLYLFDIGEVVNI